MVKKIVNVILVVLACLGLLLSFTYVYFVLQDKNLYTNSTSTYATSVTDPQTGEKIAPFTISYFENYNNLGKEVVEFRINCYSDYQRTTLYARGYQLIIDEKEGNQLYYYDTAFGYRFPSGHKYDETNEDGLSKEFYYVDIKDEVWALKIDGSYNYTWQEVDKWKAFRTGFFLGLNLLFEDANLYIEKSELRYYTREELLLHMKDIIKGCSYGTGDYTLPLVDLGDFMHLYKVQNGEIADESIGKGTLQNSYFSVDVKYDRRGLSYADQSIFESVALDSNYNVTGVNFDVNYWQAKSVYNITEQNFETRYSEVDKGFYYFLSSNLINTLKGQINAEIIVNFDVSKLGNVNVIGFDYYALNGIQVKELTISSSRQMNFNLLVGSLQNTGLKQIKIHNVSIENLSGTEVTYEMV